MSDKQKAKPTKEQSQSSADSVNLEPAADVTNIAEILVLAQDTGSESPKVSLEAEVQSAEASFAKDLTDKMSHATMPGARDLANAVGDQADPVKGGNGTSGANAGGAATKLADVVGNPHASETQWYAACEVAGDRCLAGKPSTLKVAAFHTAAVLGVAFSFLSIMACYVATVYLGSDIGWMGMGISTNNFLNNLVGLDYVGFITAGAASLTFWSAFFGFFKRTFRYITFGLFLAIMAKAISFHLMLSIPLSAAWGVLFLPSLYLAEWLGGACREALPMHIGSKRLAALLMPSLILPGLAMLAILYFACGLGGPSGPPSNYRNGALDTMTFNSMFVFVCTLIPGFVLAWKTKSRSPVGSASLSVLLQTPLLIGLLLTVGACVVLGLAYKTGVNAQPLFAFLSCMGGGDWAQLGWPKALAILGSMLLAVASAAGGGALGAWWNNHFIDKKDEKPAPSQLR